MASFIGVMVFLISYATFLAIMLQAPSLSAFLSSARERFSSFIILLNELTSSPISSLLFDFTWTSILPFDSCSVAFCSLRIGFDILYERKFTINISIITAAKYGPRIYTRLSVSSWFISLCLNTVWVDIIPARLLNLSYIGLYPTIKV